MVLGSIAHDNGLGTSLLQRLYYHYQKFSDKSRECTALLKMNHRSHCDLLDLLSKLFYNSELCSSDAVEPHSTEKYPLKFICSSLNDVISEREPTCEEEACLILKQVGKLKLKDYNSTCIMTTNQKQVCISTHQQFIHKERAGRLLIVTWVKNPEKRY